ncbi:FAD-dependent monooxygenase [Kitasatospora saccharophila]|uniref:FAD-dependent monooxygenase n=1 Tax=Kitasatospora saccharophila TaxID=407973 RepID=UPI003634CBD8
MRILISGAGVGGPALAHWLARYGHRPTVVELAPALRAGGQAVDFRGPTHLTVLRRMGLLDELRERRTGGTPMTFTDVRGRTRLRLPAEFAGGEVEIRRGDLVRLLHRHSAPGTEYLFGDTVTALRQDADGVDVTFRHAPARRFDLVIGADGLHSRVRALAFGPERQYVRHLGYYAATWPFANRLGLPAGSAGTNTPAGSPPPAPTPTTPDGPAPSCCSPHPNSPSTGTTPPRSRPCCANASPTCRTPSRTCSPPWTRPRTATCTSTRSAAPTSPPGPTAGSPCSATPPAAPPSAAWAPAPRSSPRTSWPPNSPAPTATTAPPSPATSAPSAPTPNAASAAATAPAPSSPRAPPPGCGCATPCSAGPRC